MSGEEVLTSRRAAIVRLTLDDGTVGFGEASPLPGYSPDGVDQCAAALRALRPQWIVLHPDREPRWLLADASEMLPAELPAARHGLETALLDAWSRRQRRPAWSLLGGHSPSPRAVPVAALLGKLDSSEALLNRAHAAVSRGIGVLKIKLGHRPFDQELDALQALRMSHPGAELRLDVNRRWPAVSARERLTALSAVRPYFVEEPHHGVLSAKGYAVGIGLDESLQREDALEMLDSSLRFVPVVAVVLKPMVLGGLARCLALGERAKALGLDVVVTHSFDGPLSMAAAAALALTVGNRAAGLDRHSALGTWAPWPPGLQADRIVPWVTAGLGVAWSPGGKA